MDLSGGPPLKQNQVFGVQNLWSPVTPVKNIPRRRQLISSPSCSQRSQASEPNWFDLVSGDQTATPPWGLAFQNGVCSTPGLPNHLHDLNGRQAVAEASVSQETIGCFRPHAANTSSSNAGSMNHWSPKLGENVLAASNTVGDNNIPPLAPFLGQNGNCQVMHASSNQLLLNGKVLQPQGFCNSNTNLAGQNTLYGSPVTCLHNLNSFPESTMSFSGTVAMPSLLNHMTTEKYNQRMQDKQQFLELIDLVNENAREENLLMKAVYAEASFSNMIASSEYACFQNPDCVKDLAVLSDEISYQLTGIEKSLAERKNEIIELNDASKQKPKRKKHRPKVIVEGKPARTPKPGTPKPKTPKPARDKENALGKRKYTRRNKDITPLETHALGEIVDDETRSGAKSVRRSLNFDLQEPQKVEKFSVLMSMFMQNLENHEHEACENANLASSRLKESVDSTVVQGPIVENSLAGIVFDLKNSMSDTQNEYLKILQTPVLSTLVNQTVGASKNIVNSNSVSVAPPKGIKRDHCLTDEAWVHFYNAGECASKSYDAERLGSCLPDINKRMRMEKGCNGSTCNPSPKLTYNPSSGWKTIQASNNSQEFTFTDTMKFMAQEKLQTLDRVLLCAEADLNTHNYHALSSNLSSLSGLMDYNRNSTPVKPSWQKNNDISQPPTPDKPSGYSESQESKICGTLVQFEVSEDVNKPMKAKGRTGRKKREENPLVNFPSPNNTGASHGQINPGVATTTSRHLHGKNLHPEVISFNLQDTSNYKSSTNSSFPSLSPYMDFVDYIVQKLSRLSINRDHEVVSPHAQNAIIPYVRSGGAMVPYEGTFDLGKRHRPRAKVDLDPETNRVWKLLMGIECEKDEGLNVDKAKWWEEERRVFQGRADSFIARMHLVQGDRRFSQWKGSVVDSVIGVFLTQNVSDHLSSSAFMALAAKFPLRSKENSRGSSAEKVNSSMENQIACITSLTDTPKLQRNILDHDFYSEASLEINAAKNEGKKGNSSSNETFGSGTGSSSVVFCAGKVLESHETELSFGHESPNSGSNTVVTVTRSISSVDIEDRRLVEEVVSSQNSGFSSQNSMGCHVLSSDHVRSNSTLKIEADDLLIGSMNNGFGRSSFTELLHIAESNKFQELYSHGSMSGPNSQVVHKIGNNLPVLDQLDNSKGTSQPYQADFTPHQTLFRLSDMLPESQSFYSLNPSNFTILENNTSTLKEEIRSSLPSTTCEIVRGNKLEVNHSECSNPAAENLAEYYSLSMLLSTSGTTSAIDSYVPIRIQSEEQSTFSENEVGIDQQSFGHKKLAERTDASSNIENSHRYSIIQVEAMARSQQKDGYSTFKEEISQDAIRVQSQMENYGNPKASLISNNEVQNKLDVGQTVGSNLKDGAYNFQKVPSETPKQGQKARRRAESEKKTFDWDSLRKEVKCNKPTKERSTGTMDSLDWEAVRCADVSEISETIRERGMNNMLAERIKDFLNRLVREHGSIDLEWLRDVPPDKSKDYLLSIRGLGLKSAECVRLLTLHHLAFPVDTNVGRICVRLGWVPLQPLPESLQLHLLEMYPVLETIQKYLWPRLCNLDQRSL